MSLHDTERIIEEFLGNHPHASEWRALREALENRLINLRRQRQREVEEGADKERITLLNTHISAMDKQVATLETEEAVAQFVEDSVRYTLAQNDLETQVDGETDGGI